MISSSEGAATYQWREELDENGFSFRQLVVIARCQTEHVGRRSRNRKGSNDGSGQDSKHCAAGGGDGRIMLRSTNVKWGTHV
jgi:hypothetical protein